MRISLRAARVNAELTQQQVADALNVDKGTVIRWEKYESQPNSGKVDALCRLYNMPYDNIEWSRIRTRKTAKHIFLPNKTL